MTSEDLSYMERNAYRQTLISDLIIEGVNMAELLKNNPTTRALEQLLVGIIKLRIRSGQ